jgi:NAD(P)H-dependent nitrite reductase large subunit
MSPKQRLVVVGNGMAGARFVEDVLARGGRDAFTVRVFGDDPHGNYNRILLSGVLAGTHRPSDIFINPLAWYADNGVTLHAGYRVDAIDVREKHISATGTKVLNDTGLTPPRIVESYDTLVLATGSSGMVPPIEGLKTAAGILRDGVHVFRTLDDCNAILACAETAKRAVVIGGGLLGLEAAKGLLNRGLDVHVLHLMPYVMEAQLDAAAGSILRRQLEQMGMRVHVNRTAAAILGNGHVTGVALTAPRNGRPQPGLPDGGDGYANPAQMSVVECDLVVVAAGIRPNVALAVEAGLDVERGIVVGDDLCCRPTKDVYAIGECAQHRGRLYGLVAPVWEQAQVLADRLTGRNPRALYLGSNTSTKLKVAGVELAAMGAKEPLEEDDEVVSYAEPSRGVYKKLIVRNDRLIGAIVVGDGAIVPGLVQAFRESKKLAERRAQLLFPAVSRDPQPAAPDQIPDAAQICDCNAVTKAQIVEAVLGGARSLQAVSEITRACTGCGTCRPQVQAIVELAARSVPEEVVAKAPEDSDYAASADANVVVTLNKIERYKQEKDGLDILQDVPTFAQAGWEAIEEGDRERLKWAGVFFRRQTPGHFMMRVRMPNGLTNAAQTRTLADISREFGPGFADITTRQQVQLRGFQIDRVPEIWSRLEAVGLVSLQTGMDNIRNVAGCPVAGLTAHELFDASPVAREFTETFLRNREFTNLPRKFNVAITGCLEHCTHAESQDLALVPAIAIVGGQEVRGFNVLVGGKMGSGGFQAAKPLNAFVNVEEAASLCAQITLVFRDHGSRAARNKARLAFLIDKWGVARFRREIEQRVGHPLLAAGKDARLAKHADHLGIVKQKQAGLNYVGLAVPVGRVTADQLLSLARLADTYGSGDIRLTTSQNVIVPNVPDARLADLVREPLLRDLRHDPPASTRGLVSCTGIDYCHFALIETKDLAVKTARYLEPRLADQRRFTMHWSGCPAGCGNHALADIGLLGKNVRIDGKLVDAVDVFIGGRAGAEARSGARVLEDVPCENLPEVLERIIPYVSNKRRGAVSRSEPMPRLNAQP